MLILVWVASVILGLVVGGMKDRAGLGFLLPFLFGPLGFIAVCFIPPIEKRA